jgi:hypothetical protein
LHTATPSGDAARAAPVRALKVNDGIFAVSVAKLPCLL